MLAKQFRANPFGNVAAGALVLYIVQRLQPSGRPQGPDR
jgi:hypothetical protein